jgi:hypothetical protein
VAKVFCHSVIKSAFYATIEGFRLSGRKKMKKITLCLIALITTVIISGNTYKRLNSGVLVKEGCEIIYVKGMAANTCEPAIRFNNTSVDEVLLISGSDRNSTITNASSH